uniref:Uncharacterized protein n=1 Tax=Anguilla anguilla TaxID=7936 RepID=A0A0E9SWY7_ANGAN
MVIEIKTRNSCALQGTKNALTILRRIKGYFMGKIFF